MTEQPDLIAQAPTWRSHPYRIFFPLGMLLAWAGIAHWLLWAIGWIEESHSVFHSIAQIQGFMMCFLVGFLYTALPRRTQTAPPKAWQMWVGILTPILTTGFAWFNKFAESQMPWLVLFFTLLFFSISRFRDPKAGRRAPDSFIWVPLSLTIGLAGTVLLALYGILVASEKELDPLVNLSTQYGHIHQLGSLLLLQGMFLGFIVGVGGMVLPLLTVGDSPPDSTKSSWWLRVLHVLAALALVGTMFLEVWDFGERPHILIRTLQGRSTAYLLRGLLLLFLLLTVARIWRRPRKEGRHRWLIWISAWMIPIGYLVGSALGYNYQAGLHLVFIAGFALMVFSVGLHVSLAHGGRPDLVSRKNWQVPVFGILILAAAGIRGLFQLAPAHAQLWIGIASALFLIATLVWASLWLQSLVKPDPSPRA